MANVNKVFLLGNLARDPEMRFAQSGTAVLNFSLATNRVYTAASGEKKEDTTFVRIVVWGKQAERCNDYLQKGSSVLVEGRLNSRSWETPEGQKRNMLEVVALNVQFISRLKSAPSQGDESGQQDFKQKEQTDEPVGQVPEDEVPF